jgi:hypothetical protein
MITPATIGFYVGNIPGGDAENRAAFATGYAEGLRGITAGIACSALQVSPQFNAMLMKALVGGVTYDMSTPKSLIDVVKYSNFPEARAYVTGIASAYQDFLGGSTCGGEIPPPWVQDHVNRVYGVLKAALMIGNSDVSPK